jgi:hypothetical protein
MWNGSTAKTERRAVVAAPSRTREGNWLLRGNGRFDLQRFHPKTFLAHESMVVVLIDVELTVKATGTRIVEEDEVHIWYFDAQRRVTRFGHKVDTHQHWLACGAPSAAVGH